LRLLGRSSLRVATYLVCTESLCKSENTKTLGVRFSALLSENGTERLELARA
jgi:hypothetical protein